ncbi:MAG: hypothetical protein P4L46_13655 [Fimbriimonas sp.]|nr:hypothetical protein [Fimbriimonas sp.]
MTRKPPKWDSKGNISGSAAAILRSISSASQSSRKRWSNASADELLSTSTEAQSPSVEVGFSMRYQYPPSTPSHEPSSSFLHRKT